VRISSPAASVLPSSVRSTRKPCVDPSLCRTATGAATALTQIPALTHWANTAWRLRENAQSVNIAITPQSIAAQSTLAPAQSQHEIRRLGIEAERKPCQARLAFILSKTNLLRLAQPPPFPRYTGLRPSAAPRMHRHAKLQGNLPRHRRRTGGDPSFKACAAKTLRKSRGRWGRSRTAPDPAQT